MAPHFFTLPLELRLEIYKHACPEAEIDIGVSPNPLPLLFTCRQMFIETVELAYGSNLFRFQDAGALLNYQNDDPRSVLGWLHCIGRANRSRLKRVEIDWAYVSDPLDITTPRDDEAVYTLVLARGRSVEEARWEDEKMFSLAIEEFQQKNLSYLCASLGLLALDCTQLRELVILVPGFHYGDEARGLSMFSKLFKLFGTLRDEQFRNNLALIRGLDQLTIGYTANFPAVADMAIAMGVREVYMIWKGLDETLATAEHFHDEGLSPEVVTERWTEAKAGWARNGWEFLQETTRRGENELNRARRVFRN